MRYVGAGDAISLRLPGMSSHQSAHADSTTWLTPLHIINALGPFDLDPCAAPDWPTARDRIVLPDDGLAADWSGRVWLNPPYGNEAGAWLSRLADHGRGTALIFARTETDAFARQVWRKASALLFFQGRLNFHLPDGTRSEKNAGAPSVLVAYGDEDAERLSVAPIAGAYVDTWKRKAQ